MSTQTTAEFSSLTYPHISFPLAKGAETSPRSLCCWHHPHAKPLALQSGGEERQERGLKLAPAVPLHKTRLIWMVSTIPHTLQLLLFDSKTRMKPGMRSQPYSFTREYSVFAHFKNASLLCSDFRPRYGCK